MEIIKKHWMKTPLALYVIGFLVHNSYLAQYGSFEFELVKARYLLSGAGAVLFSAMCFAFISIKVNLSYIFDSYKPEKILPWLLRVCSLPFVVYSFLHSEASIRYVTGVEPLDIVVALSFAVAHFVFFFSFIDLSERISIGNGLSARTIRSIFRVLAIPMVLITLTISIFDAEFGKVFVASTYFFFGLFGIALYQNDRAHGVDEDYLDSSAKQNHQDLFTIFFGALATIFILWTIISNYVDAIYPKLPTALGGARVQDVEIYSYDKIIKSKLVQESKNWLLVVDRETGRVQKIRVSDVSKIVYINGKK